MRACPSCGGSGVEPGSERPCGSCDGEGLVDWMSVFAGMAEVAYAAVSKTVAFFGRAGSSPAPGMFAVGFVVLVAASPFGGWLSNAEMPRPDGPVFVHAKPCPFIKDALACSKGRHVWMEESWGSPVFLHEVGHVFDTVELDRRERKRFMRAIGWWGPWRDYSRPTWLRASELFAETWSRCARNDLRSIVSYGVVVGLECGLVASFKDGE